MIYNPLPERLFGILLLTILMIFPTAIWYGYVLSTLWWWFICPLGVPAIGIAHAVGIRIIIIFFRRKSKSKKLPTAKEIFSESYHGMLDASLPLLGGFIAHGFMS